MAAGASDFMLCRDPVAWARQHGLLREVDAEPEIDEDWSIPGRPVDPDYVSEES